jgi:ATP-binding cassette subfamily F protein 3
MRYTITNGTVSAGGQTILSHIDFEIKGAEKLAVVGRNGAGKTTLLRLIAGELELDRDDKRGGQAFRQTGSSPLECFGRTAPQTLAKQSKSSF